MIGTKFAPDTQQREVTIVSDGRLLPGELAVSASATGLVIFAHGSGSSRKSPRNQFVARALQQQGLGTLLFDLLTREEEAVDVYTRHLRFDIHLLASRLCSAAGWAESNAKTGDLNVGFFGASTGAAAALAAAADAGGRVKAIVSRGGRPDLAGEALARVVAPVLLIVGGLDDVVIGLNRQAYAHLNCVRQMNIVPGATHLFEEPGALETVAEMAGGWFRRYL